MEEDLKNELDHISQKNNEYFNQISSKLSEFETLNKRVENVSKEISLCGESFNEAKNAIDTKISESTNKLGAYVKNQNDNLKTEFVDSINKVDSHIYQKIDVVENIIREQYSQLIDEKTKLQSDYNILLQKNGKLESDIENIKRELSTEKQNNTDKQFQLEQLNKDVSFERANSTKLSNDIDTLKLELEHLKEELSVEKQNNLDKQTQITQLNNDVESKNAEQNELLKQLEKLHEDYNAINDHYKALNIDETLLVAFEEFLSLTDKTKASIEALFPQSTFLGFVSAGLRLSNISALWEMAKRNIFNDKLDDIDRINKIFCLLLSVYNEGSKNQQFQIISPEVGSKYDSSTCAIKEIKSSGTVKEVLLVGYKNIKDGNIHKAVISVND